MNPLQMGGLQSVDSKEGKAVVLDEKIKLAISFEIDTKFVLCH